jgi:parvulin-like peptidyl-prolyl isomerase
MTAIVRIDDEVVGIDQFIKILKLTGQLEMILEQFVRERLAVRAAKKRRIALSADEIQARADQFRRAKGLHRATDTNRYLDHLGISLDEFESFITDSLYQEKMMEQVCSAEAVEAYFKLNSPRFDSIEVSHIVLETEGKAKEMISILRDDPGCFAEMAREHSNAQTRAQGGALGRVLRGALRTDVEAKVFNAAVGDLIGPFPSSDGSCYEIFRVDAKNPAVLDEDTAAEARRLLREEWLLARAREHVIEAR